MTAHPPGREIDAALRERFGFGDFRPGQRELVEAALSGRDALGILPTGGGKSLTYQLPATLLDGLTVVVSPLIALMKDQVDAFNRRGLGLAVAIHSGLTPGQARVAVDQARSGAARLLYLAPERLEIPEWRRHVREAAPRLLVIDEAHCVSQWGYDFRPAYLALREVAAQARPCAVLGLTATATPAVRVDVMKQLGLVDPLVFVAPFDRPNLRFEVVACEASEKIERLTEILTGGAGGGSQIVYVGRRRDAEDIVEELEKVGLRAVAYHAGMAPWARQRAQEAWLSAERPIVVATVAFGMGIDKADVRTVVHWQHPSSLEAYYQEAGRAGRDDQAARCVILFSQRDVGLHHYFLDNRYPADEEVRMLRDAIPAAGLTYEELAVLSGSLTEEQRNVAVFALLEEGVLARAENGRLRRVGGRRRLTLAGMSARREADYARLEAIIDYCRDQRCHRRRLLAYFGEPLATDFRCGNCSACGRPRPAAREEEALEVIRREYPRLVRHGPLTARRLDQFLRGRGGSQMRAAWRALPGFGSFAHLGRHDGEQLAEEVLRRLGEEPSPPPDAVRRPFSAPMPSRLSNEPRGGQPRQRPAKASVPPVAPGSTSPKESDVFWRGASRAFTREELGSRPVPRTVGMAILALVAEADGLLAPSSVANVLRGARLCEAVRAHPQLAASPRFGSVQGRSYPDLLADTLAMYAKEFLAVALGSKRLRLADSGRRVLEAAAAPSPRQPVPPSRDRRSQSA